MRKEKEKGRAKEGGVVKGQSSNRGSGGGICLGFNVECRNGHGFCWLVRYSEMSCKDMRNVYIWGCHTPHF